MFRIKVLMGIFGEKSLQIPIDYHQVNSFQIIIHYSCCFYEYNIENIKQILCEYCTYYVRIVSMF